MSQMSTIVSGYRSEALMRLYEILGEGAHAEYFERTVSLLEKGSISVQTEIDNDADFEMSVLLLLARLEIAIKQMAKLKNDEHYEGEEEGDREKFLNLLTDLLKSGMISSNEYETALKKPEESFLPWLLDSLKSETEELLATLVIGHRDEIEIENEMQVDELECLLAGEEKTVSLNEILAV